MPQLITLVNDSGTLAYGVRLGFILTRSVVRGVDVARLPSGSRVTRRYVAEQSMEVRWDAPLPPNTSVDVVVEAEGEPLSLMHVIWLGADTKVLGVHVLTDTTRLETDAATHSLETSLSTPADIFRRRAEAIALTQDPIVKAYQEFFYELDRNTHPALISTLSHVPAADRELRKTVVKNMGRLLSNRVLLRCAAARLHRVPTRDELQRSSEQDTRLISDLLLALYRQRLGTQGTIDLPRFFDAFLRFARGDLRVQVANQVWNGEPDSAYQFSFAEFGFMAIERGVEAAQWQALLPALVATQRAFMTVYAPDAAAVQPPYRYNDYRSSNFRPTRQPLVPDRDTLSAEFTGMSLDALAAAAGAHAFAAFPGGE